jgi:phospholipase C
MMLRISARLMLLGMLAAAALLAPAPGASAALSSTCGSLSTHPATYKHVLWIWMENKSYSAIIGSSGSTAYTQSPYVNGTLVPGCGLATSYRNVSHPSLPNYIAATSGDTQGIKSDCSPSSCAKSVASVFSQVKGAGKTWRSYQESMPSACSLSTTSLYAPKHNPAAYYLGIRSDCSRWDVPMGSTTSGNLLSDLKANTLPAFSFLTPNLCNDTHDCSIPTGDAWLKSWVPKIVASSAYQAGGTAVFIAWDEGSGGSAGESCATNAGDQSCHVATLVISPYTPKATKSSTVFTHYSLLKTTEQMLGITSYLGHAADSATTSMRSAFHL